MEVGIDEEGSGGNSKEHTSTSEERKWSYQELRS